MLRKFLKSLGGSPGIQGHIDTVDPDGIAGWVWNPDDPDKKLVVSCTMTDGETVEALANVYRVDLVGAGVGDGRHGFELALPHGGVRLTNDGMVSVRVLGTKATLSAPGLATARTMSALGPVFAAPADGSAGRFDAPRQDELPILLSPPWSDSPPLVLVDGFPADHGWSGYDRIENGADRPPIVISGTRAGALAELYGFHDGAFRKLDEARLSKPVIESEFVAQLERARQICEQPDAVAITCWDGGHNPIGRAKVLYDVVRTRRPAIIVSYLFRELGGRIWPPILNEDCAVLTIPWERRHVYESAIRQAGIRFSTVWICKPRLPSFLLADLIAAPGARMLLDFDDNEEQFSLSRSAATKFYGKLTINLVRKLVEEVPARTVASRSLQDAFGGHIVRHARLPYAQATDPTTNASDKPAKVGFIGTARPHKRLLEAGRAIAKFSQTTGRRVEFHVYGDITPEQFATDLRKQGVVVKSNIPMHSLNAELSGFDVILTGFPSADETDVEISRFQISSKIGDALAVRRPVLVPIGPSTQDLAGQDGVFLFEEANFPKKLEEALSHRGPIALPEPFTLDGAYIAFAAAEAEAVPNWRDRPFRSLVADDPRGLTQPPSLRPSLLLIWKQHDAGLYGRRIDQIARSYRQSHPDHDVVILELLRSEALEHYRSDISAYQAEWRYICTMADQKVSGRVDRDGVRIHQMQWTDPATLGSRMEEFLLAHGLLPQNTVVILFPVIRELDRIIGTLQPYRRILDVVDNQFSWSGGHAPLANLRQYLLLTRSSDAIVFNSEPNRDFFEQAGLLPQDRPVRVIPNWYQLPAQLRDARQIPASPDRPRQVAYSGNMRDRFDFDLLIRLAERLPGVTIHLLGSLRIENQKAMEALRLPNIVYHGPKPEIATVEFLLTMDLAIVPHSLDAASAYMDPLKIEMYEVIGLPTIATNVPGIDSSDLVTVATSDDDFIYQVVAALDRAPHPAPHFRNRESAEAYDTLIERLRFEAAGNVPT